MLRNRKLFEEEENLDRWLVSYADFITLMFAFFVVMYAISSVNEGKYRVLSNTMMSVFSKTGDKGTAIISDSVIDLPESAHNAILGNDKNTAGKTEQDKQANVTEQANKENLAATQGDRLSKSMSEIADDLRYELLPFTEDNLISVNENEDFIEVEIKSKMLFPSGSSRLDSKAIPVLSGLATLFETFDNQIQVEGFTDNQPINTAAFPSNWELSAARAASVVHLLMKKGIAPERMAAIGYGEYRPIASNDTAEGRQKNRRVVIVIPAKDKNNRVLDLGRTKPESDKAGVTP